jgi:small subunit ribosomal protein S6
METIYETVMVVKPTIEEDQLENVVEKVKKFLMKNNAKILHEESWGKKRLAYEIQKYKRAYYYLLNFEAGPDVIRKLERHYRLSEDIIRSMTIAPTSKAMKKIKLSWRKETITTEESADGSKPE